MNTDTRPLMVTIRCITYNQERYIRQCLDGFVMQKTNFRFEAIVHDDASTDGTADIIREYEAKYPDIIKPIYETENQYSKHDGSLNRIMEEHTHGKYVAICEGDDYWIDPLKLQKQVDFMERHVNHSLCFCAHKNLYPTGKFRNILRYDVNKEFCPIEDMIIGGGSYMATDSMLYRNSMYESYRIWAKDSPIGDIPTMLTLAVNGHVGYISDVMCVYRVMSSGSWNQRMASDYKKRYIHYRAMLKVFNQFDEYTGYRYHKTVLLKKRKYKKNYVKGLLKSVLSGIRTFLK